jgi:hypothetical protein
MPNEYRLVITVDVERMTDEGPATREQVINAMAREISGMRQVYIDTDTESDVSWHVELVRITPAV